MRPAAGRSLRCVSKVRKSGRRPIVVRRKPMLAQPKNRRCAQRHWFLCRWSPTTEHADARRWPLDAESVDTRSWLSRYCAFVRSPCPSGCACRTGSPASRVHSRMLRLGQSAPLRRRAYGVEEPASAARFVERRSSSAVARRHPFFRPAAGTIASRPLEQGSPWIVRVLRAIHDARETMSAAEAGSSTPYMCNARSRLVDAECA